ncbi:polysaccharide export protein [Puniceicoccaceae bacterium K14]|nr:polysaccharide export protein [Puniceicoccaceae bacterium K14]
MYTAYSSTLALGAVRFREAMCLLTLCVIGSLLGTSAFADDSSNYRLRPSDVISMSIYKEPDMNLQVRISSDGTILLPLIGEVEVAGHSLAEVRRDLFEVYDRDYFVNPQITLTILQYSEIRVQVIGQVNRPGSVVIPPEESFSILQAITEAGGFTRRGDPKKVQLRRVGVDGKALVTEVNVNELMDADSDEFLVQDKDTIVIPERLF